MRRIFVILITLCCTANIFAQGNNWQQRQQQGQAERQQWHQGGGQQQRPFSPELFNQKLEQFVKENAKLSDAECQRLFPLMHEMLNKQREINGKIQHTIYQGFGDKEEAEYEQIINKVTNLEVESKKIEQTYYKKFHSILSWKKIYRVRFALSKWNVEALKIFNPAQNRQQGWQSQRHFEQGNQNAQRDYKAPYYDANKQNDNCQGGCSQSGCQGNKK